MDNHIIGKPIVLRLHHLALIASFEEILSNLAFCRDHFPEEKKLTKTVAHSSFFSTSPKGIEVEKVAPLIISLNSLQLLTSLDLFQLDKSHKHVLKFVGHACPLLTHLTVSGFCFSSKDILSVVLGELVDHLSSKIFKKISYEHLKAPLEVLTPICFTLGHLDLGESTWDKESDNCWSVIAFVLHHLPKLKKMMGTLQVLVFRIWMGLAELNARRKQEKPQSYFGVAAKSRKKLTV